jgi:hypothetical protein
LNFRGKAQQCHKKTEKALKQIFSAISFLVAFCPCEAGLDLVRPVAIVWFRPLLVIVLRRRPRLFPVIRDDFSRIFRGPFVLISALCERSHRHHAEHRNQDYFSQ